MFLRDPASQRVTNTHSRGGTVSMKLGLKALVIALVMALAAVPAAFAKNAGHEGHGKPSWAGQGKPSWAGSGHAASKAHHEKKEKKAKKPKHHVADPAAEDDSADDVDLDGLNPAWYCKTLRDEMTTLERDESEPRERIRQMRLPARARRRPLRRGRWRRRAGKLRHGRAARDRRHRDRCRGRGELGRRGHRSGGVRKRRLRLGRARRR